MCSISVNNNSYNGNGDDDYDDNIMMMKVMKVTHNMTIDHVIATTMIMTILRITLEVKVIRKI